MKREPKHPSRSLKEARRGRSNPAGRLPAEFDRHLVEVDQMLERQSQVDAPPPGLSERLFRASVGLLPARRLPAVEGRTLGEPLRTEHAPLRFPRRVSTPVWGQVAMAASVALAFAVAVWFHSAAPVPTPGGTSGGGSMAQRSPDPGPMTTPVSFRDQASTVAFHRPRLTLDAERMLYDDGTEIGYLLDTHDLTHAEMVDDLHLLYDVLSEEL